jgi:hypothetical protein
MSEKLLVLAFLGTLLISLLGINVAVWLSPRGLAGGLLMKAGTILTDLGILWMILSAALMESSAYYQYYNPEAPKPFLSQEVSIVIGMAIMGGGLVAFAGGFGWSRKARPVVPPQVLQQMPGPPPR